MPEYTVRIQFKVIEEYEYEIRAPDEDKAAKALLAHVKNIEKIDPFKTVKFDVQETKIVSVKETPRDAQVARCKEKSKKK